MLYVFGHDIPRSCDSFLPRGLDVIQNEALFVNNVVSIMEIKEESRHQEKKRLERGSGFKR